jgi:hypothetical protein
MAATASNMGGSNFQSADGKPCARVQQPNLFPMTHEAAVNEICSLQSAARETEPATSFPVGRSIDEMADHLSEESPWW